METGLVTICHKTITFNVVSQSILIQDSSTLGNFFVYAIHLSTTKVFKQVTTFFLEKKNC